jgi:hypothetical protein
LTASLKNAALPHNIKPWMAKECRRLWVAMITSAENEGWASDISTSNLSKAGLGSPSVIRPVKIATIELERVFKKIGNISQREKKASKTALTKILV